MEKRQFERTKTSAKRAFLSLYGVAALFGITMYILVLVWNINYRGGFAWSSDIMMQMNWHPTLLILGLIIFYSQAILIFRLGRNLPKKILKIIHMSFNLIAFILAVVGLQAAFDMRNAFAGRHLYSLHSWIGLVTIILFATQFVFGFTAYMIPGIPLPIRAKFMPVHRACGALIFIFALVAVGTGLMVKAGMVSDYESFVSETYVMNFIALFLVIFCALVIYLVKTPAYQRIPLSTD